MASQGNAPSTPEPTPGTATSVQPSDSDLMSALGNASSDTRSQISSTVGELSTGLPTNSDVASGTPGGVVRSSSTGRYYSVTRKTSVLRRQRELGPDTYKRMYSAPGTAAGEADEEASHYPKLTVGVCAMDKKANSKPMRAICDRLIASGEFDIVPFGDDMILNHPIEDWPDCDCLLSWHSERFPLRKAQQYVAQRKPYLINDIYAQDLLLDRRNVYGTLQEAGIPVPHHVIVNRDALPEGQVDPAGFIETEDYVELNGVRVEKPFVEKPASGEDHNVYIYYPHSMGGGVKRLFRKIGNKSADYDPNHPGTVRRDGSYIIEEFLTTGGTDVKVYTVGPRYAHAEARKSPVVDGKVKRTRDGKEVRFPVLLNPQEKEIARMVCLAFGQKVCGFDLLRCDSGKSYVCDVNGWSFVKNSNRYYDDAAGIIRGIIISALAPHRLLASPQPHSTQTEWDSSCYAHADYAYDEEAVGLHPSPSMDDMNERGQYEELRCVLAIIRHGDRTPKQKMKMVVSQPPMLALWEKHKDAKGKQAKLKSPAELQELLDVTRDLLAAMDDRRLPAAGGAGSGGGGERVPMSDYNEVREKFRIVKTVLEQGGSFSGINRKVQLKPIKWDAVTDEAGNEEKKVHELLLILKHGGVLTHAGRKQAETLGQEFRTVMYPRFGPAGGGLLRLHSTYRHDLKIYSSDEGRVQSSAAAFTKGLLDLEGTSLTPILVSLVKKDVAMLDAFGKGADADMRKAKEQLYRGMTWDSARGESLCKASAFSDAPPNIPLSPKIVSREDSQDIDQGAPLPGGGGAPRVSWDPSRRPPASDGGPPAERGSSDGGPQPPDASHISHFPEQPLALLQSLVAQMKVVVEQLRQMCLEEVVDKGGEEAARAYSALVQSPAEWREWEGQPCSGERLLLMFDRWRKLLKAFYNEKKKQYDISKVPDIYDAAKYDAIHNAHLGLELRELFESAKGLANVVIPNEYGITAPARLRIGSAIASQLLGKVLADMNNMREESLATAGTNGEDPNMMANADGQALLDVEMSGLGLADETYGSGLMRTDTGNSLNGGELEEGDDQALHRLCPAYATDVNSPLRHVRTRIYYTSESHMHSLVNVLRFCHIERPDAATDPDMGPGLLAGAGPGLLSPEAQRALESTTELDYQAQMVFRMFENKRASVDSPERFRVELLFSPGASYNPFDTLPAARDHTLPMVPRTPLHGGQGVEWNTLERMLKPYAARMKASTYPSTWTLPQFGHRGSMGSLVTSDQGSRGQSITG